MKLAGMIGGLAAVLLLGGCSGGESAQVEEVIDAHVERIVSAPGVGSSSNPGDYIKAERASYEAIVSLGDKALPHLLQELRGEKGGSLAGWIMAKAGEDILKERSPVQAWGSGTEWVEQYDAARKQAEQ
ncbi:hypothetical protein J2T17_000518 [Paenibacillus mucilaginosus]|uniref:hypothetical protein n=1 Tax=Paenibacillus mucilaginosus TaxID=61624 RepID=UPI003D1B13D5